MGSFFLDEMKGDLVMVHEKFTKVQDIVTIAQ